MGLIRANCVEFIFPTLCDECQDSETPLLQRVTIDDIAEVGWPICTECGRELELANDYVSIVVEPDGNEIISWEEFKNFMENK